MANDEELLKLITLPNLYIKKTEVLLIVTQKL